MIQITVQWLGGAAESPSVQQFKDALAGDRPFVHMRLVQDGISGVISTMYVTIVPSDDMYSISISSAGHQAHRIVTRGDIYKTLLDGYGLWSL